MKSKSVTSIGMFGQSGAGKTTIIRSIPSAALDRPIMNNTGIIRKLFAKNPLAYKSPMDFIQDKETIMASANPGFSYCSHV